MKFLIMMVLVLSTQLSFASSETVLSCSGKSTFLVIRIDKSVSESRGDRVAVWSFGSEMDLKSNNDPSLWNWDYVYPTAVEYIDDQEPIAGKNYDFWVDSEDKLSISIFKDGTIEAERLNTDTGGILTPLSCEVAK